MKFSCGLTWQGKVDRAERLIRKLQAWHKVFLWLPTTIDMDGEKKVCAWLCTMECKYPDSARWGTTVNLGKPLYREAQKEN